MGRAERRADRALMSTIGAVFTLTGASALALQVLWQRVISMHSGVDLTSSTTVVAGFLAGLGLGTLLGGQIADRVGPGTALRLFAAANIGVAAFAWFSIDVFYDLYRHVAHSLSSRPLAVLFDIAILLVPTTLLGLSLPLVARAVTRTVPDASIRVGRLLGLNTLGAAVGAIVGGWWLMGAFGFVATARIAAACNLVASVALVLVTRLRRRDVEPAPEPAPHDATDAAQPSLTRWCLLYGALGAVALGFEQVFFRLVDSAMRSNSYSFSLVLAIYVGCWGSGATLGAVLVRRAIDPVRWFRWLQTGAALGAAFGLVALVRIVPWLAGRSMTRWFNSDGFAQGFAANRAGDMVIYGLGIPALIIALPVVLLGTSYPFVQAIANRRVGTVGRRTAALAASNLAGNVVGTVVVGFFVIDRVGTAGTYRLLTAVLAAGAIAAFVTSPGRRTERILGAAVVVVLVAMIALMPTNHRLWSVLVGGPERQVSVAEDRSCGSVVRSPRAGHDNLLINGASQNGYPFDDFHVLIGLMPALVHPDPTDGLAVGFGIGSTTSALLADHRVDHVTTVELCGGNYELARGIAAGGNGDFKRLLGDPRSRLVVGDGRRHLLVTDDRYDVIVVDTLRPTSANSGSHFSEEFFELAASRLRPGGVFANWVPSARVQNAAGSAFPYVVTVTVPTYGSTFFLGSNRPMDLDRATLLRRFDAIGPTVFAPDQRARLRELIASSEPRCVTDGRRLRGVPSAQINHDLEPRDEFTLNNPFLHIDRARTAC